MSFLQIVIILFGDTLIPETKTSKLVMPCPKMIPSQLFKLFMSENDSFATFHFDIVKASLHGQTIIS